MKVPAIDILLSTYNGHSYLREQIDSILNQTCNDWRLLIRDDGSTDDTLKIIELYTKKYSHNIQLLEAGSNVGPCESYSILGQRSSAPYIMFCDQDDIWLHRKVEISFNHIRHLEDEMGQNVPLLVFSDLTVTDDKLNVIAESFWDYSGIDPRHTEFNKILLRNVAAGCSMIANRSLMQIALPFPPEIIMHDYWCMLVAAFFGHVQRINHKLALYRQHTNNKLGAQQKTDSSIRRMLQQVVNMLTKGCHQGHSYLPYIRQADILFNIYKNKMSGTQSDILESFIHINDYSFLRRKYTLLKYNLLPFSSFDNIISFLSF